MDSHKSHKAFVQMAKRLGGIQQLRGQERGEGGSTKSPPQEGGPLNVHVDQNLVISESLSN